VRVGPTLQKLLADYPNDLRVVYKQHPLPMHSNAMLCAQAVLAANAQGKFAAMHPKILENSATLTREKAIQFATEAGLDVAKFTKDLDTNPFKDAIAAQTKEAMDLGAGGTPASFINGRYLSGAQPYEAFKKLIDEELAKVKK
jgi:protein-disulfide isomerase